MLVHVHVSQTLAQLSLHGFAQNGSGGCGATTFSQELQSLITQPKTMPRAGLSLNSLQPSYKTSTL